MSSTHPQVPMSHAKRILATAWFTGAGLLFGIVFVQSVLGKYGEDAEKAWSWLLPTVLPTLSLIVGVLVADAMRKGQKARAINRFLFRLALSLSIFYLAVDLLTLLLQPFAAASPLELLEQSNLWLAPLQGLNTAALGAFFVRGGQDE